MQQNWYAVYTKPQCERKVSLSLGKMKIQNFCPLNYKKSQSLFGIKNIHEPIFKSYVFVKTTYSEVIMLTKKINDIISIIYWKNSPAIVNEDEVNAIKEFANNHHEIRLEKSEINSNSYENSIESVSYIVNKKVLKIKNSAYRLNLPSLGFTLVSGTEVENKIREEMVFNDKKLLIQS